MPGVDHSPDAWRNRLHAVTQLTTQVNQQLNDMADRTTVVDTLENKRYELVNQLLELDVDILEAREAQGDEQLSLNSLQEDLECQTRMLENFHIPY